MARKLAFLARWWRMMTSPASAAEEIALDHAHAGGWVAAWLVLTPAFRWVGEVLRPEATPLFSAIAAAAGALIGLAALLAVSSLVLRAAGARGSARSMLAWLGYAGWTVAAALLLAVLLLVAYVRLMGPVRVGAPAVLLFILLLLAAAVASMVMMQQAVSVGHGLSSRRAWIVVLSLIGVVSLYRTVVARYAVARPYVHLANLQAAGRGTVPITTARPNRLLLEISANRLFYRHRAPARGDVVVLCDREQECWLARILGLPGEEAGLRGGDLVVDGRAWVPDWRTRGDLTVPARRLAADEYLVWTDDRRREPNRSQDSELPAFIVRQQIVGTPLRIDETLLRFLFGPAAVGR